MFYFSNHTILALALTFLIRIAAIILFYNVLLLISAFYINSIGSTIAISDGLLLCSLVPIKSSGLTQKEREEFSLSSDLKGILVGLMLGDLHIRKQIRSKNPQLIFLQGTIHKDYLYHLYGLFESYCLNPPKTYNLPVDKRTGKVYSNVVFRTYSLPCFGQLYDLFYLEGKKIVPANIADLITEASLAYLICDDGSFYKPHRVITISTQSFSLNEVNLLVKVLNDKFNLNCTINKSGSNYKIRISAKSVGTAYAAHDAI